MKAIYRLILFAITIMFCYSCTNDFLDDSASLGDKEVWVEMGFGCENSNEVTISTRGTHLLHHESMVINIYAFVFVNGQRVYCYEFNADNKVNDVSNETVNCWSVTNMTANSTTKTNGKLRMKLPVMSGASIYLIANQDLDFMNVSTDRLNLIHTESDLLDLVASLNQTFPERNAGYFMMTGKAENLSVSSNGVINVSQPIQLKRLDAKIEVNVIPYTGETDNLDGGKKQVKNFIPQSWQAINLPNECYLMERDGADFAAKEYFNTDVLPFDISTETSHSFSFYMLENHQVPSVKAPDKYDRDSRYKIDGVYAENDGNIWQYAPQYSTYLIIKGELQMDILDENNNKQQLTSDVTYYVHLGDFDADKDDYTVKRNTHYTYNITVKGVNNIILEVRTNEENQPGATGHVYTSKEDLYTFDAHYGQRVYVINRSDITAQNITWYVRSPFGREGVPTVEYPTDMDYKWVQFRLCDIDASTGLYKRKNKAYPGNGSPELMYVPDFINLLKENPSVFDKNGDVAVIAYVDEYYYEKHPLNEQYSPEGLWKEFVNKPNRMLHLLCNSKYSVDGESSETGSIITIRQRSIQTPYNMNNPGLSTAWGCEVVDEQTKYYGYYSRSENPGTAPYSTQGAFPFLNNDSDDNGLYNTVGIWELNGGGAFKTAYWSTYLDYDRENDHELLWMKDEYAVMRWSTLMRNRDNNGNGIIDPDEIRWYQASKNQLLGLYIGGLGVTNEAQLYDMVYAEDGYTDHPNGGRYRTFRRHVLSSSKCGQNNSILDFWAEQGIVTTKYRIDLYGNGTGYEPYPEAFRPHLSIRCVRNLGMEHPTAGNIVKKEENLPEPLVKMKCLTQVGASAVYAFNLSNVNEKSLRYYTSKELLPTDENSISARTYKGFITGVATQITAASTGTTFTEYNNLKSKLDNNQTLISDAANGYRVPNIREAALMTLYIDDAGWWGNDATMVSTYAALGQKSVGGMGLENGNSWCFGYNNYIVQNENVHSRPRIIIRSVRDIDPEDYTWE